MLLIIQLLSCCHIRLWLVVQSSSHSASRMLTTSISYYLTSISLAHANHQEWKREWATSFLEFPFPYGPEWTKWGQQTTSSLLGSKYGLPALLMPTCWLGKSICACRWCGRNSTMVESISSSFTFTPLQCLFLGEMPLEGRKRFIRLIKIIIKWGWGRIIHLFLAS